MESFLQERILPEDSSGSDSGSDSAAKFSDCIEWN
jgi:hypothetical protein